MMLKLFTMHKPTAKTIDKKFVIVKPNVKNP